MIDPYAAPKAQEPPPANDLPLAIRGFERQSLALRPGGFLKGTQLVVDGTPVKPDRRRFRLRKDDGTEVVAVLKQSLDPIPQLEVEGTLYRAARPLTWYEWGLCVIPVLLIVQGGALGGACGFLGFTINAQVLRSPRPLFVRVLISLAVDLATGAAFLVAATLFSLLFARR